jgi:sulfatase maturation enzyme AslB (radical SAM superfamily)
MKLENNITHLIQEFKANTNSESINFELVGGEPTLY